MTIKARNTFITIFMFVSLALILGTGILTGIQYFLGNFSLPQNIQNFFLQNTIFTKFNFLSVVISIFLLLIYVFLTYLYINVEFEKTQSTEIIYFSLFLFGCIFEATRLLVPINDLWNSSSKFAIICTRIVLLGRCVSVFSLLLTVICSSQEYRQYVEQNIVILFVVSLVIAVFFPINSGKMRNVCIMELGFHHTFQTGQTIILFLTWISEILQTITKKTKNKAHLGLIMLSFGYVILREAFCYLLLTLGFSLIIAGTFIYLKDLHKQYLWN